MIFKKYFRQKNRQKKLAFLTRNKAKLRNILIITFVFEKKRQFFRQKLAKIADNCDHNIDPRYNKKFVRKSNGRQDLSIFGGQCYDFKNIFAEKNRAKISTGKFTQNLRFMQKSNCS
jgi:hypothetical protein